MKAVEENIGYKHADYLFRSDDKYAQMKYKIVMSLLPLKTNIRVLNAGCGSGEMNLILAQNKSWYVEAFDIDNESIALSKKIKDDHGIDNLAIFKSSIQDYVPSERYDIIVLNDVLEHIEDDLGALDKLAQMLKPDGTICVTVPALQSLYGYHDEMLGHFRRYNKSNLLRRLSTFFEVVECRYFGGTLIPAVLVYSRLLRKPYPSQGNGKSILGGLLDSLLRFEYRHRLPLGTSLIALGKKKGSQG
jgi:SAM-dependent methyltransferase